jgi:hypothetical protein
MRRRTTRRATRRRYDTMIEPHHPLPHLLAHQPCSPIRVWQEEEEEEAEEAEEAAAGGAAAVPDVSDAPPAEAKPVEAKAKTAEELEVTRTPHTAPRPSRSLSSSPSLKPQRRWW